MSKKMILLKSSDGESFEVEKAVALQWQPIAHLVQDDCANSRIPISNVTPKILGKVIEYCKKHDLAGGDDFSSVEDLKKWDAEFMQIDQSKIFDLMMAANYLNIPSLLTLACQTIADMIIACKDPKEIRAKFGIESDFTPEEEEALLKENRWGFERLVNLNPN